MFLSARVLPRGIMEGLGGKVGSACVRNLTTTKMVYWVNVSESSGTGSHGLSWIKGRQVVVVFWLTIWH